ncbi:MAG: alpha/beta hydrolase [Desulfobacterales bacterium]|nr:alpha/beta hydrolase [Desulfobacterales bacterium]
MPFVQIDHAKIYYEETGSGEPVIGTHGLIENTTYWSKTGVSGALAKQFRVILMDMRAHGRSVVNGELFGYDVETAGKDIEAVADHLGLGRFHLISHSTGGFASARYAMENSHRLISLILTDSSSATSFFKSRKESEDFHEHFAQSFENFSWEQIMEGVKKNPFPFFRGIAERKDNQAMWDLSYEIIKTGDRKAIAQFVRSFYTDPDPMIEGLRKISCPTLVLLGEKDDLFIEPSKLMAREIPDAKLVIIENTGHMTAIEEPERVSREILDFLLAHPQS